MTIRLSYLFLPLLITIHLGLSLIGTRVVPVHWDEGWNLCVARTWVEDGHYGCKFDGAFTTPRLSTGVVAVAANALGFFLFDEISAFPGRVPYLLALLLFLLTFYSLGKALFSKEVAALSLGILLLFPDYRVSPALLAVQSHSEVFLFWFLALGYLSLLKGLLGGNLLTRALSFGVSILSFGIALQTKHQVQPFLLLALATLPVIFLKMRDTKGALLTAFVAVSIYFSQKISLYQFVTFRTSHVIQAGSGTVGLADALGMNLDLTIRARVFLYVLNSYWFHLLGVFIAPFLILHRVSGSKEIPEPEAKKRARLGILLSMYIFILSWTGWFLLLSIDFPRYFSPPAVFGSLFGAWGVHWIYQFVQTKSYGRVATLLLGTLLGLSLLVAMKYWNWYIFRAPTYNTELKEIAEFLNRKTGELRLETYETQVFHLLNIPYVYPPDQMNVTQIENHRAGRSNRGQYNYSLQNPTHLLVGEWSREVFELYPEEEMKDYLVVSSGDLRLYDLTQQSAAASKLSDFHGKTTPAPDLPPEGE